MPALARGQLLETGMRQNSRPRAPRYLGRRTWGVTKMTLRKQF